MSIGITGFAAILLSLETQATERLQDTRVGFIGQSWVGSDLGGTIYE